VLPGAASGHEAAADVGVVSVAELDWARPETFPDGAFDYVLAADCV
jgi:hypothetical protein